MKELNRKTLKLIDKEADRAGCGQVYETNGYRMAMIQALTNSKILQSEGLVRQIPSPTEQGEGKTADGILAQYEVVYGFDKGVISHDNAISAMHEYAAQFKPEVPVSDAWVRCEVLPIKKDGIHHIVELLLWDNFEKDTKRGYFRMYEDGVNWFYCQGTPIENITHYQLLPTKPKTE